MFLTRYVFDIHAEHGVDTSFLRYPRGNLCPIYTPRKLISPDLEYSRHTLSDTFLTYPE